MAFEIIEPTNNARMGQLPADIASICFYKTSHNASISLSPEIVGTLFAAGDRVNIYRGTGQDIGLYAVEKTSNKVGIRVIAKSKKASTSRLMINSALLKEFHGLKAFHCKVRVSGKALIIDARGALNSLAPKVSISGGGAFTQ